ncbi:MAG TPA: M14 family zinc carboxypeptidase [Gemmatimonadaceae bacterium]|nr:M14 family zinc carboxypeptidase [Gemmatimonadaceae bacterium]
MPRLLRPRLALIAVLALLQAACASAPRTPDASRDARHGARASSAVPAPAAVLGFEPGADRKLPAWSQVVDYFTRLDAASPRVVVRTLGRTTMGRPFIAAFIGDSATIADLPRYADIQRRLADPRLRRGGPGERDSLIAAGKAVVLVTSSIHSDEVGGILAPLVLAHRLASAEDDEARRIRAGAITILVPSLNPDGVDIVGDWYRSTLGTRYEGAGVPVLYHKYTGHDNNRDWYAFTQVETRLTVDSLHNVWHPEVVNDIHQQGAYGSRIFLPPYLQPVEPNVDSLVIAGVDSLGRSVARRLRAEGRQGVVTDAIYDAWTPARAYQHYHGGARILTETASARLASPIVLTRDSLRAGRGYDARRTSANFPVLWPGGRWTLADIVSYQASAAWAILATTAAERASWLERFARVGERAVAGRATEGRADWPVAFVIPQQQPDQVPLRELLRVLQRGGVEVRRATSPFASGNVRYSAGAYVVLEGQPYFAFAKALLESQRYPDLRDSTGAPRRPNDVTAHTLPLLMGVGVGVVRDSFPVPTTEPIAMVDERPAIAPGLSAGSCAGAAASACRPRRIAVYRSWSATEDEGWTRWVLDRYGVPFTSLTDSDVRAGDLGARYDVVVLPDQAPEEIADGLSRAEFPDSLAGGLGAAGAAALRAFVDGGGTLVALNRASRWAIDALGLPVRDVLAGVSNREFYAPGSILALTLDRSHPMARDVVARPTAWFESGPAFEVADPSRVRVVAAYPADGEPLLSGWLLGGARLRGRAALVDVTQGRGHVVLFGFRPQYRGQSLATYPLLWGALREWSAVGGARSAGASDR